MLVQIKFTATGGCAAIGEFSPGDTARIGADLAKHLVEEARCADYVKAPAAEAAPVETKRKGKGRK